jgi:hypothetical protein
MALNVTTITASTYAIPTNTTGSLFVLDASSNGIAVTLPSASGQDGNHFYLIRIDSFPVNAVTMTPSSGQTINGNSGSYVFTKYKEYHVVAVSGNWLLI